VAASASYPAAAEELSQTHRGLSAPWVAGMGPQADFSL